MLELDRGWEGLELWQWIHARVLQVLKTHRFTIEVVELCIVASWESWRRILHQWVLKTGLTLMLLQVLLVVLAEHPLEILHVRRACVLVALESV